MKKIGLVGMPNAGKSSIFKLLTGRKDTLVANYCFSTMDKEVENFKVWDKRVRKISSFFKNPKLTFSDLKISDIPGIVKDAHKNKGLGSRFISHIRECDLIFLLIRFFEDDNIVHFEEKTDPLRDFDILTSELILSDIEQVEKAIEKVKENSEEKRLLSNIKDELNSFNFISKLKNLTQEEQKIIKSYNFLTNKPIVVVANVGEDEEVQKGNLESFKKEISKISCQFIKVNIKKELEKKSRLQFENDGFFRILNESLKMKNFFTAGEKEVKSWTIEEYADAKECAGLIHSDIKNRLIRVSVVNEEICENLEDINKKKRKEKKDYLVKDGDICDFIFN